MRIGRTLRLLRESRKLSQKEVAERAGIGKSQLSKYEKDREVPKLDSLERVLDVLGGVELPGFFTIASFIDRCVTEMGSGGGNLAALILPLAIPRLGFPEMEHAFREVLSDLLTLHGATLEALYRPREVGRPAAAPQLLGLDSRD